MTAFARTWVGAPPVERLILDLGGVILPSAMQVTAELAARSQRSERQPWRLFNARLLAAFWSGRMDLESFDRAPSGYAGVAPATGRWRTEMTRSLLRPLPPAGLVRAWARRVPVGVLPTGGPSGCCPCSRAPACWSCSTPC